MSRVVLYETGGYAPTEIAGVDEAGRGCLAGPVVAAAVTVPPSDTRAAVRGAFVAAVEETGQQASVSWAHVRLDSPPRPQLDLPDPFAAHDDAVAALVEEIRTSLPHHPGGRSGLGWLRHGLGDLERGG